MGLAGIVKRERFLRRWVEDLATERRDPKDWLCLRIDGQGRSAIYVPVPKAANTSIRYALLPCFSDHPDENADIHHHPDMPTMSLWEQMQIMDEETFLFTVVRHPAERILSTYRNKMGRGRYFGHAARLGMNKTISFDEFLKTLLRVPPHALDSHFKPQALLLGYALNQPNLSIYKSESIDDDWKGIASKIFGMTGRNPLKTLDRLNATIKSNLGSEFTKPQRLMIEHLYHEDFSLFGYDW